MKLRKIGEFTSNTHVDAQKIIPVLEAAGYIVVDDDPTYTYRKVWHILEQEDEVIE